MKVRVIGCHGGVAPDYQTSCYQVDDGLLIDAGSLCSVLTPQEQMAITDVVVTHPHLDHIKDLCFLLENTFDHDRKPLTLYSTKDILQDISKHLFNGVIWPDFSKIYIGRDQKTPILKYHPIETSITIDGKVLTPFKVNHPGHAVGYVVDNGHEQVIFTGDSGACSEIWKRANKCDHLKAIFTEISFPSRMEKLAEVSGHFTLTTLLNDLKQLKNKAPLYISHFKPLFFQELMDEFYSAKPDGIQLMHENDEFTFS